jgi:hypothetical protein
MASFLPERTGRLYDWNFAQQLTFSMTIYNRIHEKKSAESQRSNFRDNEEG